MRRSPFAISQDVVTEVLQAVGAIAALTAVILLIGRPVLGEAVIAVLCLLASQVTLALERTAPAPGGAGR